MTVTPAGDVAGESAAAAAELSVAASTSAGRAPKPLPAPYQWPTPGELPEPVPGEGCEWYGEGQMWAFSYEERPTSNWTSDRSEVRTWVTTGSGEGVCEARYSGAVKGNYRVVFHGPPCTQVETDTIDALAGGFGEFTMDIDGLFVDAWFKSDAYPYAIEHKTVGCGNDSTGTTFDQAQTWIPNSCYEPGRPTPGYPVASEEAQAAVGHCYLYYEVDGDQPGFYVEENFFRYQRADCDTTVDSDGDRLGDCLEYEIWTDPSDVDTDDDGIDDDVDLCPIVPGDDCEEVDTDSDGVPDTRDECVTTPGGGSMTGCPDSDGDAVPDHRDDCPTVPAPGTVDGCPEDPCKDNPVVCYAPLVFIHDNEDSNPMPAEKFAANTILKWAKKAEAPYYSFGPPNLVTLGDGGYLYDPATDAVPGKATRAFSSNEVTRPRMPLCESPASPTGQCKSPDIGHKAEGFYLDLTDSALDSGILAGATDLEVESGGVPVYTQYVPGSYIAYWFFFPNSVPGSGAAGVAGIKHQGDWEHIVVRLDTENEPLAVEYFFHHWSHVVPWGEVTKLGGTHPHVYAAEEGHGSYWSLDCNFFVSTEDSSMQTLDDCSENGANWRTWQNLVNVEDTAWYGYGGAWGSVGLLKDTTGPPGPHPLANPTVKAHPEAVYVDGPSLGEVMAGSTVRVGPLSFGPLTLISLTMFSTPRPLGAVPTTADGTLEATVTIPTDAEPGTHELVLYGPGANGGFTEVTYELEVLSAATPPATDPPPTPAPGPVTGAAGTGASRSTPVVSGSLPSAGAQPLPWVLVAIALLSAGAVGFGTSRVLRSRTN
ncbi:thrombospondin type 3 repeat-containing protein [Agromyces sp. CF514]|uniref:thrombospondin type 3 repeat-containing protein n=1 Tax=Agromyces sp. CF514 TaxID=1881031 RepID=UPI0015A60290|nr:thrombospondin type 3 repeat-containing protein [Agromyces sp. CF514]